MWKSKTYSSKNEKKCNIWKTKLKNLKEKYEQIYDIFVQRQFKTGYQPTLNMGLSENNYVRLFVGFNSI
jgi:hypothetical protein